MEVIMSHIFNSHYTVRALESIGSKRTVHLVDNSFSGEMRNYSRRNPHVFYLRPKVENTVGSGMFHWKPMSCAASWNTALSAVSTEWAINVNPDVWLWPDALSAFEKLVEEKAKKHPYLVLVRSTLGFNVWAGKVKDISLLGWFDTSFSPCGGEDEDMLLRISRDGSRWSQAQVHGVHMDGGHMSRVDGYCNIKTFREKHGFPPNSPEYREEISRGRI